MKRLLFLLLLVFVFSTVAEAQLIPKRGSGYVYDFANVLTPQSKQTMEGMIAEAAIKGYVQLAVVTVPDLQGYNIADFAIKLGNEWGVGKKVKNNGVVLLLAPKERKVFIATGYGVEVILTDAECRKIYMKMKPSLKHDHSAGLLIGVEAIISKMKEGDQKEKSKT